MKQLAFPNQGAEQVSASSTPGCAGLIWKWFRMDKTMMVVGDAKKCSRTWPRRWRYRYFNHPRLRKYHIGTSALPIISATV